MKRAWMVSSIAVLALFAALVFSAKAQMMEHMNGGGAGQAEGADDEGAEDSGTAMVKEAEAAKVTVKVEYKNPGVDGPPVFRIAFDTHSVELDGYRFEDATALRDFTGRVYKASLVSESGSGHHREATLVFKDAAFSSSAFVEIIVKGVAGVDERVFRFDLPGARY